jgi:hypothetical protein
MARKLAGTAYLTVNQVQWALRGNFVVSPSSVERTMVAGQEGVCGYHETPRVPFIEGDLTAIPEMLLEDLETQVNVTVVAKLANGMVYTLTGAMCKAALEENTRDGVVHVRWEGLACQEFSLAGVSTGKGPAGG